MNLFVQIVRFLGHEPQPGTVACEFVDAEGRTHTIVDKVPIFSMTSLDDRSSYPQPGVLRCEVPDRFQDLFDRQLVRIHTDRDGVESTDGISRFVVRQDQLSSDV